MAFVNSRNCLWRNRVCVIVEYVGCDCFLCFFAASTRTSSRSRRSLEVSVISRGLGDLSRSRRSLKVSAISQGLGDRSRSRRSLEVSAISRGLGDLSRSRRSLKVSAISRGLGDLSRSRRSLTASSPNGFTIANIVVAGGKHILTRTSPLGKC